MLDFKADSADSVQNGADCVFQSRSNPTSVKLTFYSESPEFRISKKLDLAYYLL